MADELDAAADRIGKVPGEQAEFPARSFGFQLSECPATILICSAPGGLIAGHARELIKAALPRLGIRSRRGDDAITRPDDG
jgi:hypothetical protein